MQHAELLSALNASRAGLEAAFAGLTEAQMMQPGAAGDWSVKDVLSHCTAWEAELVTGLAQVRRGRAPQKALYTEEEIQAFNAKWSAESSGRPLDRVLADFQGVRKQTLRQLEAFGEAELNAARPWYGGRTIAQWVENWLVDHEAEHSEHIAAWRRRLPADGQG